MQTLSNNLRALRKGAGFTLQDVANQLRISRNRYEAWENRNVEPSAELLIKLADLYHLSVDELLRTEPKKDKLSFQFAAAPLHVRKAVIELLRL